MCETTVRELRDRGDADLEPFARDRIGRRVKRMKQLVVDLMGLFQQCDEVVVVLPVVQLLITINDVRQGCKVELVHL